VPRSIARLVPVVGADARPNWKEQPATGDADRQAMANLSNEQRRALRILARHPDGCAEAVLLAEGFSVGQLAELALEGLAETRRAPRSAVATGFGSRSQRRGGRRSLSEASQFRIASADAAAQKLPSVDGLQFVAKLSMVMPSNACSELVSEQKKALGMLAASLLGRVDSLMQPDGITIGTLRDLVRSGTATADIGLVYFDPRAIVTMLQITDAGRRAIGI
jgi:hypothetical protein